MKQKQLCLVGIFAFSAALLSFNDVNASSDSRKDEAKKRSYPGASDEAPLVVQTQIEPPQKKSDLVDEDAKNLGDD